ncbi:MAG: hypothetical protein JO011_17260, partial [Ktedonobacteraceae bacterium]|nr:hypothetical protein [Ktedonobacteraceae bacterium]MBV9712655.1 hypothetical protein [Ktedonobacteraceae bacterium]
GSGSTSSSGNSGSGSTSSSGNSGSGSTSSSSNAQDLIHTATAMVGNKSETILTDAKGMTLYYFTPDTSTQTACADACAKKWPPLLAAGASASSSSQLPGTLNAVTTTNGSQVEYNGHLLYRFAKDKAAGQTKGENVNGKWFVATPDLATGSGSSSGYGY